MGLGYKYFLTLRRTTVLFMIVGIFVSGSLAVYPQKKKTTNTKRKTEMVKNKKNSPKTSAEAKKQQAQALKEIQLTQDQIRENERKVSKGLSELGKLDVEIGKTQSIIKELNQKISRIDKEITGLQKGIETNETELSRLREEYLKAIKKMRVTKKNKNMMAFLFSSKSMNEAMRRMRYLKEFSAWKSRQTDEINAKIIDLKHQKEALSKAREEQKTAMALQKSSETKLAGQRSRQAEVVAELRQNGKALEAHLAQKRAEAKELGNIVSQLIAEEQRKAEEEARRKAEEARKKAEEESKRQKNNDVQLADKGKKVNGEYADARKRTPRNSSTETKGTDNGFLGMKGRLPYPSTGSFTITGRFGRQTLQDLPDVEYDNPGIDAESDAGASARAVYPGKVSGVYLLPGYNTVVIVNHGNYYTVYGNIATPAVKIDDTVETGSTLGPLALSEDTNGKSSIHFEVWRNREKLNPEEWLR